MGLIAPVLMGIVLFYWLAFCLTVAAWLKALGHLLRGNFIRSALWLNLGTFLLFWWTDKPHDCDTMMPGVVFFTGLGALGTFASYCRKRKAMLAIPAPVWTPPKTPANDNQLPMFSLLAKSEG
jgi:hypothetical protein